MILNAATVRKIVNSPDLLFDQVPSDAERAGLAELGITPFVDRLLAAYIAGEGVDTAADDVHSAAVRAILEAERDAIGGEDLE